MKKTLITSILALGFATVASAATVVVDNAALVAGNGSYTLSEGLGSGYGNVAISMVLDADAFQNAIKNASVTNANIFTATANVKIGIGLNTSASGTGLYGSWQSDTSFARDIAPVAALGDTYDLNSLVDLFTANTYTSVALTYSLNGSGAHSHLTLVDADGVATTISGTDSGLKASSFGSLNSFTYGVDYVDYVSITTVEGDVDWCSASPTGQAAAIQMNLDAIAAASVPEPATASLSLLGLAALMMRRRRA